MEAAAAFDIKRPPVTPGRELGPSSPPRSSSHEVGPSEQRPQPSSCGSSAASDRVNTPPLPLPRRSQVERRSSTDGFAPLGFEPEGGSGSSSPSPTGGGEALSTSPPNYLEWAKSFSNLLNDPEGLHLFRKYLAAENQSDLLEFWFACEGLKKQSNQEQINLIVKCIYRRYFKDSRLGLSDQCLSSVLEDIRVSSRTSPNLSSAIFASSQQEVERIINVVVYRNFLQSDIYLNYIHHMTQDSCSGSTTGSSSGGGCNSTSSRHSSAEQPPTTPHAKTSGSHFPDGRESSYTTHCSSTSENFSSGGQPTSSSVPPSGNFPTGTSNDSGNFHRENYPVHERLAANRASSVPNESNASTSVRNPSPSVSSSCNVMSKSAPNPSSLHLQDPPSGNFHRGNFPARNSHSPKPPDSPVPLDIVSDTLQSLTEDLASSLPTLHEDEFFDFRSRPLPPGPPGQSGAQASQGPKLTKDLLLATARKRTIMRPKPETFAGMFLKHGPSRPNPYSLAYNSYNPVSRHDSDIQSLSSDARSGSDLSLNTSGVGGQNTLNRPSKHSGSSGAGHVGHSHPPKPRSIMNREENLHNTIIPRTLLKSKVTSMKPKDFADLLITKLTAVKRDRDTDERLLRSLNEGPIGDSSTGLSSALSERFPHCAEDDQDILDQHIESVFDKIGLSPGFTTPSRPKSPEHPTGGLSSLPPRLPHKGALPPPPPLPLLPKVLGPGGSMGPPPPPPPHHQVPMSRLDYLKHHKSHRDRDGNFSMFTSDSGNVQDMTDGTETLLSYGNSSSGCYGNPGNYAGNSNNGNSSCGGGNVLSKSKSMPDYGGSYGDQSLASCSRQGSRRYITKRSDSQIFDSGISGISCSTNATPAPPAPALVSNEQPEYLKNRNVAQWLMESSASSTPLTETKNTSSTCTRLRHTTTVKHKSGSRSCSSERPGVVVGVGAGTANASVKMHPYVTDPSMPPLNPPHTFTQLEEVSRRLLEKDTRPIQSRFKPPTPGAKSQEPAGGPLMPLCPPGARATGGSNPQTPGCYTTVVFTFCEEQYPYRTKIPSNPVTLKQFKDYLPKKGNYRFFFKTECDDVDTKVIQEEIVDDNEVLPLWEGKVMGQVKPLENENMGHY